jgi:preprotein translocase subunit YajC
MPGFRRGEKPCLFNVFRPENHPMIGTAYAQAAGSPAQGDTLMGLLPIILMFVILYFLMIRPQMKKAKEHKSMLDALQKGDEVIAVGILGKITRITDNYIGLEVANNVVIQVQKQAITVLLPKGTIKDAQ